MNTMQPTDSEFLNMLMKSELLKLMSFSKDRYLQSVILNIIERHPDQYEEIIELLTNSSANQKNDRINTLLSNACLPGYPEHDTLDTFDQTCLSEPDLKLFQDIQKLDFLKTSKPNLNIYGPPGFGRERIATGLGDLCCRAEYRVRFIEFHNLMQTIRIHERDTKNHKLYDELLNVNCLIIDDFAGEKLYDAELINGLELLIHTRMSEHQKRFIQHKKDPKQKMQPRSTVITSSYVPIKWVTRFTTEDMTVLKLANLFLGSGHTLTVDETNKPENADKLVQNPPENVNL